MSLSVQTPSDSLLSEKLQEHLAELEHFFKADVVFYFGQVDHGLVILLKNQLIDLKSDEKEIRNRLVFFLNTSGGTAEVTEMVVEVIRHHYREVFFVVPNAAMSAGTILALSGDKLFMDYSSSLGPVDPQVYRSGQLVPASGYIDKVEELIAKSTIGNLSAAEFTLLGNVELGELSHYEQARDLSVEVLKNILLKYKLKNWTKRMSTGVTLKQEEKEERAEWIAKTLASNKFWHSHNRQIGIKVLQEELLLIIDDYGENQVLSKLISNYNNLVIDIINRRRWPIFLHSRTIR